VALYRNRFTLKSLVSWISCWTTLQKPGLSENHCGNSSNTANSSFCCSSVRCDSNNWSGDFEGSTVLTYPKSTFCSYTIAQRCTLPWSGVSLGFCLHSTSSYPGSQRGQTDTVCCKRLVTGNDNYTYLRTKPRWTTLQTCCREFVRSLKVCSLPRSKNYKFYSIYKPNLGPTTKKQETYVRWPIRD